MDPIQMLSLKFLIVQQIIGLTTIFQKEIFFVKQNLEASIKDMKPNLESIRGYKNKLLDIKSKEKDFHYGIKLVRGAYMEKERDRAIEKRYPSPIQPDKASCDRDFDQAIELIIDNLDICALCSGSHNENSANHLAQLIEKKQIDKTNKRIFFAQLLGMSDHISYNLSHLNYNVAKYVPYGPIKEVMPYLLRRADENTSVAGQTGRELSLIMKELNRRKKKKTA